MLRQTCQRIRDRLRSEQKAKWDRIALSWLDKSTEILDLGCGEGRFISLNPQRVVGVDWNSRSLTACRQKGYRVVQGDVRKLPFSNNSFAAVHCSHVIEHFLPHEAHRLLREADRVLQRDGLLIIRSPLLCRFFYETFTHVRPYDPMAIIDYFTPSSQLSLPQISTNYKVTKVKWRYTPLQFKFKYIDFFLNFLNRWGFPWLEKSGYMLVMRKH